MQRAKNGSFKFFFSSLFLTTLISYANYIIPFLPLTVFGFNWSGVAWLTMLLISSILLVYRGFFKFPILYWLPWIIYLLAYIILDFSIAGLQLTMQYLLPILIGIIASSFRYTRLKLKWLFKSLINTLLVIYLLFIIYNLLYGFTPHMAATPMFFSIGATISLALFFFYKKWRYLLMYFALFLMPFVNVTRMALLVFGLIFILHFANKGLGSKLLASFSGLILMLWVVSSEGFQQKTFFSGQGAISDLSWNYYENKNFNASGRLSWKNALTPGLEAKPIWGNGPRADAPVLGAVVGRATGEAHNDYLSVRYNYGYVGLFLLIFAFVLSFLKLFQMSKRLKQPLFQLMVLSMLTLFIPFLLFMYSDNILKYTIWFPNYFFAMMGIIFSMYKKGYSYA